MGQGIIRGAVLVLGGVIIIASLVFAVTHLTDHVVFTVLLPGVIVGLVLIGVYVGISKRGGRRWPG